MALTYGFYDSVASDRLYTATQMSRIFDGLINDGMYSTIGTRMEVRPFGAGLQVIVGEGRAWFNHTWTLVDAEFTLTHDAPHVTYPRYDSVVLEVNADVGTRVNTVKIVKGTAAASPVPPVNVPYHSGNLHQYPLAQVYIPVGLTLITAAQITNKVGTSACPYVTGVLTSFNIDSLITQWEAEWDAWTAQEAVDFEAWLVAQDAVWNAWMTSRGDAFDTWWAAFVDNLTTEQATNLQLQIIALQELSANRDYYVRTDGNDANTGLENTSGAAFLTIQKAINVATALDLGLYNVTIHVADGTYTGANHLRPYTSRGGMIYIEGNTTTPANVFIDVTDQECFDSEGVIPGVRTKYSIRGFKLKTEYNFTGASCINIQHIALTIGKIQFDRANLGHHIYMRWSNLEVSAEGYSVSAQALAHLSVSEYSYVHYDYLSAITFLAPCAMGGWITVTNFSNVLHVNSGFINSYYVTNGQRYLVQRNSIIDTNGGGANFFPGTVAGAVYTQGQYL